MLPNRSTEVGVPPQPVIKESIPASPIDGRLETVVVIESRKIPRPRFGRMRIALGAIPGHFNQRGYAVFTSTARGTRRV